MMRSTTLHHGSGIQRLRIRTLFSVSNVGGKKAAHYASTTARHDIPGRITVRRVADDVMVFDRPLSVLGCEIGCRMTVIRLQSYQQQQQQHRRPLFVHSPFVLDDESKAHLDRFGEVRWIIAPNKLHSMLAADFAKQCKQHHHPHPQLIAAPGLPEKRPDIPFDAVIPLADEDSDSGRTNKFGWEGEIDHLVVRGLPFGMNEVLFLHRPSHTVVATNLAMNIRLDDERDARPYTVPEHSDYPFYHHDAIQQQQQQHLHDQSQQHAATDVGNARNPCSPNLLGRAMIRLLGNYDTWGHRMLVRAAALMRLIGNNNNNNNDNNGAAAGGATKEAAIRHAVTHWEFDRLIVSHGDIVETGGKEVFKKLLLDIEVKQPF